MDADDISPPERLRMQIDFMERRPDVGLLGGAIELISSKGTVIDTRRPPLEDSEIRSSMLRSIPTIQRWSCEGKLRSPQGDIEGHSWTRTTTICT